MSWERVCESKPGGMRKTRPFVRTSSKVLASGHCERTSGTKAGIAAADFAEVAGTWEVAPGEGAREVFAWEGVGRGGAAREDVALGDAALGEAALGKGNDAEVRAGVFRSGNGRVAEVGLAGDFAEGGFRSPRW